MLFPVSTGLGGSFLNSSSAAKAGAPPAFIA
jgi:hypothetical protein